LAPLLRRRHWYGPGIPFRRLEPLASGERERDGIWSEYLNVVAEEGAESRVAEALAGVLAGGGLGAWDEVVLPRMDGKGPLPDLLTGAFRRAGLHAEAVVTGEAPYIPLPATWEAYLKALRQRHRYLVTRSLRDFQAWAGGPVQFERAGSLTDLERGQRILVELHQRRWEQVGLPGVFRSARFLAFHEAVMPLLLAEGALELVWLTVRDQPVAALYNIVWNGKVYFYQSGRRTDVPRKLRPGIVVLTLAIRAAIEAGRREFDFLGDACRYKRALALASRPVMQVRAVRERLREGARLLAERVRSLARAFRRRPRASEGESPQRHKGHKEEKKR
jgi:CelD/BcsL family acetyltransferase involved in cellulose biosynthesis